MCRKEPQFQSSEKLEDWWNIIVVSNVAGLSQKFRFFLKRNIPVHFRPSDKNSCISTRKIKLNNFVYAVQWGVLEPLHRGIHINWPKCNSTLALKGEGTPFEDTGVHFVLKVKEDLNVHKDRSWTEIMAYNGVLRPQPPIASCLIRTLRQVISHDGGKRQRPTEVSHLDLFSFHCLFFFSFSFKFLNSHATTQVIDKSTTLSTHLQGDIAH